MQIKSKKELAITLFKALSFYSLILALRIITGRFPYSTDDYDTTLQLLLALEGLAALLLVIFAIIIWIRADAIASVLLKNSDDNERADVVDIYVIAFSFIGLCLLCSIMSGIVDSIDHYYYWLRTGGMELAVASIRGSVSYLIVKLIAGLWLLFGSRRIVNVIMKLRRE